ncbi:MAG: hypothetical protein HRU70_00560 [Phycisphaeraceae bacterium]|nr:MAG: hypothetical protein HRU70_00560 [Phycisphaeraceae bacterium]
MLVEMMTATLTLAALSGGSAPAPSGVSPASTPATTTTQPGPTPVVSAPQWRGGGTVTVDARDPGGVWLWHKTVGYDTTRTGTINYAANRSVALLSPRSYPAGRADSVRRPGFNGRLWVGEICIGGVESYPLDSGDPGTLAYGARGLEHEQAFVRVGPYAVGVNPWASVQPAGRELANRIGWRLEDERNLWLKEQGFVGGVRTFQNDLTTLGMTGRSDAQAVDLTPKAVIPAPTDVPKFRPRMQVRSTTTVPAGLVAGIATGEARVSMPATVSIRSAPVVASGKASEPSLASRK